MSGSDGFSLPAYISNTRSVLLLVFSIIAILAVVLRFWARRIQKVRFELNDYMIVLGLVFALAQDILYIYQSPWEFPLYVGDLDSYSTAYLTSYEDALEVGDQLAFKLYILTKVFWAIAVGLIRSSIVLLYIRIFPARSFRFTCYAILAINAAFSSGVILADGLICNVTACWGYTSLPALDDYLNAIISLLLDVTVVVLPMPLLWGLQMTVSKKVMLSGMFGLGTAICTVTAYRIQQTKTTESIPGSDTGVDGTTTTVVFLKCLEAILGVLNACLPVLKPIFNKVCDSMKRFSGWKSESKYWKNWSAPKFVRVNQMWGSRIGKHTGRGDVDSTIPMQDWRNQNVIQSTNKADRVLGTTTFGINVQKDVYVETAPGEGPNLRDRIVQATANVESP